MPGSFLTPRRLTAALFGALSTATLFAACAGRDGATRALEPGDGPSDAAGAVVTLPPRALCTVDLSLKRVTCADSPVAAGAPSGPSAIVVGRDGSTLLGGLPINYSIAGSNVVVSGATVSFDVAVMNMLSQRLSSAPGNVGVRLVFVTAPAVANGTGAVSLIGPATGTLATDAASSPDGRALPAVTLAPALDPIQRAPAMTLRFSVPATVKSFTFGVYLNATVPFPEGWVELAPTPAGSSLGLVAGGSGTVTATVRDAGGRIVTAAPIAWASSAPTIAAPATASTTAAAGATTTAQSVRAIAAGTALITATSGARRGTLPITVAAAPATLPVDYTFTIDPTRTHAISRYVYGANFITDASIWGNASTPAELTLNRIGGNRLSAYNWETNHSNAGNDWHYQNDTYLSSSQSPGAAVSQRATPTFARGAGLLLTVPMLDYVAADARGVPLDTLRATRASRLAAHFVPNRAAKGSALSLTPSTTDGGVAQDEFVNWFVRTYPGAAASALNPVLVSLDNEPDLWHGTHAEVQSDLQTYTGFSDRTVAYAKAVKAVFPNAVVLGPAVATWAGMATLGRYPSPDPAYGSQFFLDVYLDRMKAAETANGRRLVDVLDVHWYPESGTNAGRVINDWAAQDAAMVTQRVQAPRSLWDPTYTEGTWVSSNAGGPVRLIPRLREKIAARYPGTKIAITEYSFGRTGDVSGGVAQADALGIFGREGVYAATLWPLTDVWAPGYGGNGATAYRYAFAAFRMFLNYDGVGGRFGDTGLAATTTDNANSSVYASLDAAGNVVVIAINKTTAARTASIQVGAPRVVTTGTAYTLTSASAAPVSAGAVVVSGNAVRYTMPAMSVSTIVLR